MMWQGNGCIMYEIFFVNFVGHNFVSGLRTQKPKKPLKTYKNLKT